MCLHCEDCHEGKSHLKKDEGHKCRDCNADISERRYNALYCFSCAKRRARESNKRCKLQTRESKNKINSARRSRMKIIRQTEEYKKMRKITAKKAYERRKLERQKTFEEARKE